MSRAAIGVRVHSGWGALVTVSDATGVVEVIDRRPLTIASPRSPGAKQPYHFAEKLELAAAQKFLANRFAASRRLASAAVGKLTRELGDRGYRAVGSAVLLAPGRALPPLASVLASHALIHSAEGEFFRAVMWEAFTDADIAVSGFRERDLDECAVKALGRAATSVRRRISTLGRSIGPPWTADQKAAALAASIVLANKGSSQSAPRACLR